jgi:hypothetical protein
MRVGQVGAVAVALAMWALAGCTGTQAPPAPEPGRLVVQDRGNQGHVGLTPAGYRIKRFVTPYDYRSLPAWRRLQLINRGLSRYRIARRFTPGLGWAAKPPGPGLVVWLNARRQVTAVSGRFPARWGTGPWLNAGRQTLYCVARGQIGRTMAAGTPPALTRTTLWLANPSLHAYHVVGRRDGFLDYAPNGPGLHFWMDAGGRVVAVRYWMPAAAGFHPWDDEAPGAPRITRFGAVYTQTLWFQVPPGFNQARTPGASRRTPRSR